MKTALILFFHLWPQERSDLKSKVIISLFCLLIAKIIGVISPLLFRDVINSLEKTRGQGFFPLALIMGYGFTRVLQSLFNEARDFFFISVSQHAQRQIALTTFAHLHKLSLAFHLDRQTGGLSRVIERGIHGISFLLSFLLFNIVPTLVEIVVVTIVLGWSLDYRISILLLITVVIYITFTLALTEYRLRFRVDMNKEDTDANAKAIDSLLNFETVKYFNNEAHEFRRFNENLVRYERAAVVSQKSLSALNFGQATTISIGTIAVLSLAGYEVAAQRFNIGDLAMLSLYMTQLFVPLNFLGFVYREMKQGLIDMGKMTELWEIEPGIKDNADAKDLIVRQGKIEFRDVHFSYNSERTILQNISFTIESGQTVALVGPSGSGKSTIARLLFRFYDPSSGSIFIDEQNLADITQASLHATIGVVPQDTVLFNDSIAYNISYGRPDASHEEIRNAAKHAHIEPLINKLKYGMGTIVGERGLKLSGGEKQRVSIARTILKNPPILIFDEATSALDSGTEKEINKELDKLRVKRSTLVIAHRLSTIMDADLILVLKDGSIFERGTHQDLMKLGGLYRSMWDNQVKEGEYRSKLAEIVDYDQLR